MDDARTAIDELRYDDARVLLELVVRGGDAEPVGLVALYRELAFVKVALGDIAGGRADYQRMLALEPRAVPAAGVAPKIQAVFDEAAVAMAKGGALTLRHELRPTAVVVTVVDDPMAMVAKIVVRTWSDATPARELDVRSGIALSLPVGSHLVVAARDAYGNVVARVGSERAPLAAPVVQAQIPLVHRPPLRRRPLLARSWLWAGVTVFAGATTGWFAWHARDAQRELDRLEVLSLTTPVSYDHYDDVAQRGRRAALNANVGLGVTGVLGAVTLVLLVLRWAGGPTPTVAVTPGGAQLGVGARF